MVFVFITLTIYSARLTNWSRNFIINKTYFGRSYISSEWFSHDINVI